MIPVKNSHLFVAAKSHAGMSGKNNEDRYAITAYQLGLSDTTPIVFAVVADGIGGHRAGETAAEIAVETISEDVAHSDASHPVLTLREAIIHASNSILAESETDGEKKGMGATCACVWVIGDQVYTATVGDSRIYLVRGDTIQQLSTDHTWVQEAIGAGLLSPEEARSHPNAHVIRRYLGSRQTVEPDTRLRLSINESDAQSEANQGVRLLPKEQLFLCSDGLTDLVNDDEILQALKTNSLDRGIESLIQLANQRGGHDNITIVVLSAPDVVSQTKPLPEPMRQTRKKRDLRVPCLVSIALVLLFSLILLAGGFVYSNYLRPTLNPTAVSTVEATQPVLSSPETTNISVTPPRVEATLAPSETLNPGSPGNPTPTFTSGPTDTSTP